MYIITTLDHQHYDPHVLSRRAVATLDEAREETGFLVEATSHDDLRAIADESEQARTLSESGGTIGPLPNGTVIEVEFRTWLEALRLTNIVLVGQYPSESEQRLILDALNA